MITVLIKLEDYDGWAVDGYPQERQLDAVPRKGEYIVHQGIAHRVLEIRHDLDADFPQAAIKVYARAGQ